MLNPARPTLALPRGRRRVLDQEARDIVSQVRREAWTSDRAAGLEALPAPIMNTVVDASRPSEVEE